MMSRAFTREEDGDRVQPVYRLPAPDAPEFPAAAAAALLEGARIGNTQSAEDATGVRWGDPALVPFVEAALARARDDGDDRLEQVAARYLRQAHR
jgi:hypothetical protein